MELKKSAIDLTGLAIGVVVLGIVVSIGAIILTTVRDTRLTELDTISTINESLTSVASGSTKTLANTWIKSFTLCKNATSGATISTGNYTTSINSFGQGVITPTAACVEYNGTNWKCDYTWYNTSRADWNLPNQSMIGLGEYGNWFKIIVIVGVAALILGIIFMAFGGRASTSAGIGGSY